HDVGDRAEHLAIVDLFLVGAHLEDERRADASLRKGRVGEGLARQDDFAAFPGRGVEPAGGGRVLDRAQDLHGAGRVAQPLFPPPVAGAWAKSATLPSWPPAVMPSFGTKMFCEVVHIWPE